MSRSSLLPVLLLMCISLTAQQRSLITVQFSHDSWELSDQEAARLRAICDRPDADRIIRLEVNGHTDTRGDLVYNNELSRRRAEQVQLALSETCLRNKEMIIRWSGEIEPLIEGENQESLALNRRVEIVLITDHSLSTSDLDPVAHMHPHVTPLMPSLDVPRSHYIVDASHEIAITADDGVKILIPAGAVVDQNGLPVSGPIDITYRSFGEPYEIIASGIPMHVNTAGEIAHFETAGMYELYASKDGRPLSIAAGQNITLERPGTQMLDEDFIGWELDETSGGWVPAGTITATQNNLASFNIATDATNFYWAELRKLQQVEAPDSTTFAERRLATNYCHLAPCSPSTSETKWKKKRDQFDDVKGVPKIRILGYKGIYDPDRIVFTVDLNTRHFPEWRRLPYNAVWEYTGNDSRKMFKRLYGRKHVYQDIDLVSEPGSEECLLRLKENGEWLVLPVSAKWNMTDRWDSLRWARGTQLYKKTVGRREQHFDRKINREYERYKKINGDPEITAWKAARRYMNEEEMTMDRAAWSAYVLTRPDWPMRSAMLDRSFAGVRTTFGLEGFGLFNIDRIMKMPDRQNVIVETIDPSDEAFPWVSGYAVLNNENSVVTYWGNGNGKGDELLVAPGRMRSLYLVDAQGNIALANVDPLNTRGSKMTLSVMPFTAPESIEELRAQAGP